MDFQGKWRFNEEDSQCALCNIICTILYQNHQYRLIIDNSHGLRKATLTFSSSDDVKTEHLCSAVMTLKAIFMWDHMSVSCKKPGKKIFWKLHKTVRTNAIKHFTASCRLKCAHLWVDWLIGWTSNTKDIKWIVNI